MLSKAWPFNVLETRRITASFREREAKRKLQTFIKARTKLVRVVTQLRLRTCVKLIRQGAISDWNDLPITRHLRTNRLTVTTKGRHPQNRRKLELCSRWTDRTWWECGTEKTISCKKTIVLAPELKSVKLQVMHKNVTCSCLNTSRVHVCIRHVCSRKSRELELRMLVNALQKPSFTTTRL